jgi:hypothetical protein
MTTGYKDVPVKVNIKEYGKHDIPLKVSLFSTGWSVPVSGDYQYQANYYGTTASTIKIDTSAKPGADDWDDYMMVGYLNLATAASANHRIGFVMRYQDTSNYYFIGFKTDTTDGNGNSTYEVYKKDGGSYSRIANQYDNGSNYSSGTETYYAIPDNVGTSGVLSADTQYYMRVDLYGNVCRMYLQNVLVFENTTDFSTFSTGEVGLEAYTQSSDTTIAYFDTIKVVS